MGNALSLFKITDRIKKVYEKLYELELTNEKNDNFYILIEHLKKLLLAEDEIYKKLTYDDIVFIDEYISMCTNDNEIEHEFLMTKYEYLERISSRIAMYFGLSELDDDNWYLNLKRGIYLSNAKNLEDYHYSYYYLIYSSWNIINFINSYSSFEEDIVKLKVKYSNMYHVPFVENFMLGNNFEIYDDYDYGYILKIIDFHKYKSDYMNVSADFYERTFKDFVDDTLLGKIKDCDDYFVDRLIGLDSFLELVNDEVYDNLYEDSCKVVEQYNVEMNDCLDSYFGLFDYCQNLYKKM